MSSWAREGRTSSINSRRISKCGSALQAREWLALPRCFRVFTHPGVLFLPHRGPKRFDFGHPAEGDKIGSWFSIKEGETHELWSLLRREFTEIVGEEEASILTPEEL